MTTSRNGQTNYFCVLHLRLKKYLRREIISFLRNPKSHYLKCTFNFFNYLRKPKKILTSRTAWKKNLKEINSIAMKESYIAFTLFGFKPGNTDISLYQFLAITSFVHKNPRIPVYIFYAFDNDGFYWKKLRQYAVMIQLSDFDFYRTAQFSHYAHKSDVLRLIILQIVGGLYFDIDTISVGSIDSITDPSRAVLGLECNPVTQEISGICNAIMWSPRQNPFIKEWIYKYRGFYSKGKDAFWGEHSIRLPLYILRQKKFQFDATVLPPAKLFAIDWLKLNETVLSSSTQNLWNPMISPPLIHLWETLAQEQLNRITPKYIQHSDDWYAVIARESLKYINESSNAPGERLI